MLRAVESHAREKCCHLVLLSTHTFQAPRFYARLGYEPVAQIEDYPVGHADIFFAKRLGILPRSKTRALEAVAVAKR